MKNSVKFNKKQHDSESVTVEGFEGLHKVDVAGGGENPKGSANPGEPYTYGVNEDGERDGSATIVLVNIAKTKAELKSRMVSLVDYSVSKGNSLEDAIGEVIRNVNHARNINQRQPFRPSVSNASGIKEVAKEYVKARKAGVTQESIEAAIAALIALNEQSDKARMAS